MSAAKPGPIPEDPGTATGPWQCQALRSLGELEILVDQLARELEAAGFPDRDVFGVRLALEEALSNAVRHGNAGDPSKSVKVRYHLTAHQFLADVEDQGPGFDPQRLPDPLAPENLERPSGRGVFLMRYYMTWVRYNDRGNCVTLCKRKSA